MNLVAVVKRVVAGIDVIDRAVFRHQSLNVFKLFGTAVKVRLSGISTPSAVFGCGAFILQCRLVYGSGFLLSTFHLSGSGAAVYYMLEKD